jgi:hypothetical protein
LRVLSLVSISYLIFRDHVNHSQEQPTIARNVICIIDGSCAPFSTRLITLGSIGGHNAARKLVKVIKDSDYFDDEPISPEIFVFVDVTFMVAHADEANVRNFIIGFNQAGCNLYMIDIGSDDKARIDRIEGT